MSNHQKAEEYIASESQEISWGENPALSTILKAFPAMKHYNYRLWFVGQFTSLVGTWIQMVAQGWLVFELTHSAFWVGVISALGSLPILIFTLFGGVLVDRYSKKKVLFMAETFSMLLSLLLGIIILTNHVTIYNIAVIAFLLGFASAIDMPARLAFAIEMVGRQSLPSALAINAGMFNAARVIGPGLAGGLIAFIGMGWAFVANAASFLAVLVALYLIKVKEVQSTDHPHPIQAIREGLSYSFSHKVIRTLLIFAAIVSVFGWSYSILLPVIISTTFKQGVATLGYFNAVSGLGAVISTIAISAYGRKINPFVFIIFGSFTFSIGLFLFSFTSTFIPALITLFFVGMGIIMQFATINLGIQRVVEDSFRGRAMSIFTLMFLGMTPVGSLQTGYIAEKLSPQDSLRLGALIIFCSGIILMLTVKRLKLSKEFDTLK